MAKPPKTTQFTTSPETTPNSPKLSPDEVAVNRTHTGSPDPVLTFNHPTETVATPAQQGAIVASPSVTVSHMPDTISAMLHTYLKAITWPDERLHLLTAQDPDTGLFTSPQGDTYAHISGEGYFQVERQHDGGYRIYWPAALGEPGPLLTRTEGQPHWRTVGPGPAEKAADAGHPLAAALPALPPPLLETQARWLTAARDSSEGFRFDSLGAVYIDMQDGATYQVRKRPDGRYQLSSSRQRNLPVTVVEQVPGNTLWRIAQPAPKRLSDVSQRQPQAGEPPEATPGPSKRARLAEDHKPHGAETTIGEWVNWGTTTRPTSGDSIAMGGRHYLIVPQTVSADTHLVHLQNPLFKPNGFDGFEQMLDNIPALQPKWVVKVDDTWTVMEQRPFEIPLTRYVARFYQLLTEQSSSAIARAVFNRANAGSDINGDGLRVLFDTFYHWENRSTSQAPARDLADPLMMLPVLPTHADGASSARLLALPSPDDPMLRRIDFDTRRFNQQWSAALNTPGVSLRSVFSNLLEHNGYTVDRTSRLFSEDTLLFERKGLDCVFLLRIRPASADGTVLRPLDAHTESAIPALRAEIEKSTWKHMLEPGKVIFLLGGTQKLAAEHVLLFIVREG
ncbi:hypothetical protein [Pseudomonas sp.]|uniref:hypothetical protein n=1 Tax=Pseudomonas sp. TaxID=306 RepID=UPI003BB52DBC